MYYNVTEKGPDGRSMAALKPGVKSPCCQVCGDESSGFHYGVDSCEGCKGFFRRCITQGMTHKCNNEEKCDITPFTRNSCQYCRLKKCFSVGMSREASRLGRRPKRLKEGENPKSSSNLPTILPYPSPSDLFKLKMAELQKLLQQNGTFKSDLMQAFLSAAQTSFREHSRTQQDQGQKPSGTETCSQTNQNLMPPGNQQNMIAVESGYSSLSSPSSLESVSPPVHDGTSAANNNIIYPTNQDPMIKNEPTDNLTNPIDVTLISDNNMNFFDSDIIAANNMNNVTNFNMPSPTSATPSPGIPSIDSSLFGDNEVRWDSLQSQLSVKSVDSNANESHIDTVLRQVKVIASDARLQLIKQITSQIIDAHFATTINIYKNVNEANEKFQRQKDQVLMKPVEATAEEMWMQFKGNMVPEITKVVKFCKKIPGFAEIVQDDQIKLIKQGTFEVLLTRFCMLVDFHKGEMFDPAMKMKVPRSVVRAMPLGDFLDEFFNMAEAFNPLNLTDGEIGLFTAVLLFSPDRESLSDTMAITKIRHLFEQSLYQQMKTNHADPDDLFRRLFATIPLFRDVNSRHAHAITNMKIKNEEEFPDLHNEVFDTVKV